MPTLKVTDFEKYPFTEYEAQPEVKKLSSVRVEYDGGRLLVEINGGEWSQNFSVSNSVTVRIDE